MRRLLLAVASFVLVVAAGVIGYELGRDGQPKAPRQTDGSTLDATMLSGLFTDGSQDTSLLRFGRGGQERFGEWDDRRPLPGRAAEVAVSFVGTTQDGVASWRPVRVDPSGGSASLTSNAPALLSVTDARDSLVLGECTGFLHYAASLRACDFTRPVAGERLDQPTC